MAETLSKAEEAYWAAEGGSPEELEALEEWLRHCATVEEVRRIFFMTLDGEPPPKCLVDRWTELSLAEIAAVTTSAAAEKAWRAAPNSEVQAVAHAKWDEVSLGEVAAATTWQEAMDAWLNAPSGGRAKKAALERLVELTPREEQ